MKALHFEVFCMKKIDWILMTRNEADAHERRCPAAHFRPMAMDRSTAWKRRLRYEPIVATSVDISVP